MTATNLVKGKWTPAGEYYGRKVSASGGWKNGVFTLKLGEVNTPFIRTLILNGKECTFRTNVGFGPNSPLELKSKD